MSHQEEKISKFLDYPYDSFLMLRLEFMLIFQDELIAKVLRIIEKEIETERKRLYRETVNKMGTTPTGVVDITKDIYVAISYKTFMSDLFDTVTSENTLKRAVKELEKMKVIFRRHDQKKRYDAPEYKIHQPVLQTLLSMLKKPGYQNLIPSTIEALKKLHPHEMTPSECQSLIPSIEDLSTKPESRVSKFDPNYNNSNTNNSNNKEVTYAVLSDDKNSDTPASFSPDQLEAMARILQEHGRTVTLSSEIPPDFSTQATAVENPGQLADRVTVSQTGDNGVREASAFSQGKSDTDLPVSHSAAPTQLSPTPKMEVTSQNEVLDTPSKASDHIAAVATRNLDEEEHAPLSRSGESAPVGDGVQTPPGSGASGRNKRTRTSEDETIKARVERVFAYFDTLKQETTGKPEEHYARTKAAAKEIKDTLLPCGPTELKLRKVYLKLWNTPPSRDGSFHWKDHMTIKAVCGQYESVALALDAEENAEAEKKRAKQLLESVVKSPAILVQAEDDYVFDIERVRGNRGRRSAS